MNLRRRIFYHFLRGNMTVYFGLFGNYHWKVFKPKSKNYLVLTNHNTNWDFFYFGLCLRKPMYFVASEHIFRKGWVSKLIVHLVDPIPRKKGGNSNETVDEILRRLANGDNVCMMAEGNRSFSGKTGYISPATAALVKKSGVGLLTFALHGGYFVNPRWGKETRKGPLYGGVVREYTAEELSQMSEEEITEVIRSDLYVNAFDDPYTKGKKYKGKDLAENLEIALFTCPKCGKMGTLESKGDRFYCKDCGFEVRYTQEGFFESENLPYNNVLDWYRWQLQNLNQTIEHHEGVIFEDQEMLLSEIHGRHETEKVCLGTLRLDHEYLSVEDNKFDVHEIKHIAVAIKGTLLFTMNDGRYFEVTSERAYNAIKYMMAIYKLIGKEYK